MGYFFAKADPVTGIISEEIFKNKVLFFIWTEVLKDYGMGSEPFINPKTEKTYKFTDFFDKNQNALKSFIEKPELKPKDLEREEVDEEYEDSDDNLNESGRDYGFYSVNGEGRYSKRKTVLKSLEEYISFNPDLTVAEIIENWKQVNPGKNYFLKTEEEYDNIIRNYPDQQHRYYNLILRNKENLYLTNQWGGDHFNDFMKKMNESDFGILIEKID